MQKSLSILILTLPVRLNTYSELIAHLYKQIMENGLSEKVEIMSIMDCKTMSVGVKRNKLLEMASGKYVCFIDDDDRISGDYVKKLFAATKEDKDVITFCGEYVENNGTPKDFKISILNHSNYDTATGYYRLPNHLCPVKREIALKSKFTDKNFGEDSDYSLNINRIIKNEYHLIDKLYFYDFNARTTQTAPNHTSTAFKNRNF